jgi:hypothetical protein
LPTKVTARPQQKSKPPNAAGEIFAVHAAKIARRIVSYKIYTARDVKKSHILRRKTGSQNDK